MRPLRFLLLLTFFVIVPIILTFWSLISSKDDIHASLTTKHDDQSSGLRTWFSFTTPSSLFPPSAIISLKNDNSTFFLARPAAFGPSLASRGINGRLWVGKGFGDDALWTVEDVRIAGWELGCSDVPGWGEEEFRRFQALDGKHTVQKKKAVEEKKSKQGGQKREATQQENASMQSDSNEQDDGTDDHLHRPHPDSNPATPAKVGEPADAAPIKQGRPPIHADIESLQESADIAGKIVMLARGGCGFLEKVKWAQRRGGIALIVGDNQKNMPLTIMYAKGDTSNITIPALFTSYTSAHILSSLVPPELVDDTGLEKNSGSKPPKNAKPNTGKINAGKDEGGPVFTTTDKSQATSTPRPQIDQQEQNGWFRQALSAVGIGSDDTGQHGEDSYRPPSSGNIDWVLVEGWDEEDNDNYKAKSSMQPSIKGGSSPTSTSYPKATRSQAGGDNFVIGIQDWRDADLVAPLPSETGSEGTSKGKKNKNKQSDSTTTSTGSASVETALKGGSITPGSGEYDRSRIANDRQSKGDKSSSLKNGSKSSTSQRHGFFNWLARLLFRSGHSSRDSELEAVTKEAKADFKEKTNSPVQPDPDQDLPGLWVTLTPTSVSTSPFFDTLLVLVVSPLVTLTFVYGLLLLRSRIRRRRWRAPKSVVDRLPVRTYHTLTSTSSSTSLQVTNPERSTPTSPLLSSSQDILRRSRPRSQTSPNLFPGSSSDEPSLSSHPPHPPQPSSSEKNRTRRNRVRKYTGRQVECVVCLEEYVDGESRVMSLPCGHEFHVECITPWLVTRRRTCPICKGDVVRSFARSNTGYSETSQGEEVERLISDGIQDRTAESINDEMTSAIAVPFIRDSDDDDLDEGQDLERGPQNISMSMSMTRPSASNRSNSNNRTETQTSSSSSSSSSSGLIGNSWRNLLNAGRSTLSGDTLWGQSPTPPADVDRSR